MDTQTRIVTKTHELFMRYGIRSISMDEIASQLGMSKKTIYQFFSDKDALVNAVVDIEVLRNEQECINQKNKCLNAIHEVFLAMDMVQEMLQGMNPAILYDLKKYHPNGFKKFSEHKDSFFQQVVLDNLNRGIAEGIYRANINQHILSKFRVHCMFLIFDPETFPSTSMKINEVLWSITENFLYGLATSKGVKLIEKYTLQRQKPQI